MRFRAAVRCATTSGIWLVLLAGICSGCSGSPSRDGLVGRDQLLVPGDVSDFHVYLAWQYWPGSKRGDGITRDSGPVMVLNVDGAIVAAVATPLATLRAGWSSEALRPIFGLPQPGVAVAWKSKGFQVEVRSLVADRRQLLALQPKLRVSASGHIEADVQQVGELPPDWQRPSRGVIAAYDRNASGGPGGAVTAFAATRAQQRSFLALLHQQPNLTVTTTAGEECCSSEVYEAPVARTIKHRKTTIGTLTPTLRAVIIEGSPGAVLLSPAAPEGGFSTNDLFQVAASLHARPRERVAAEVAKLTD